MGVGESFEHLGVLLQVYVFIVRHVSNYRSFGSGVKYFFIPTCRPSVLDGNRPPSRHYERAGDSSFSIPQRSENFCFQEMGKMDSHSCLSRDKPMDPRFRGGVSASAFA
jgi:hypothetical protein